MQSDRDAHGEAADSVEKRRAVIARLSEALRRSARLAAELERRMDIALTAIPATGARANNREDDASRAGARATESAAVAELLTLADVARLTGRHPELLRRWCSTGRVPARRIGRTWLIDRRHLTAVTSIQARARPVSRAAVVAAGGQSASAP